VYSCIYYSTVLVLATNLRKATASLEKT